MTSNGFATKWSSTPLAPSHLLRLIRLEPNSLAALRLFETATASGSCPDPATVSLLSSRLAASGHFSLSFSVLSQSLSPAPEHAFLSLLRSLGHARRPLAALRLFRLAPKSLTLPHSAKSYNAVLALLVSNGQIPLALSLFDEMRKENIVPTVGTHNVMLKVLCVSGYVDKALRLFRGMAEVDACSYNIIIDGLCKNGKLRDAKELFDEMPKRSIEATVMSFTTVIHWFLKSGDVGGAMEMFSEMCKRGISPNKVTYSSLIDGLCKEGQSIMAYDLLNRMIKERISPNGLTYRSLVCGLCKGERLNEAMEVFDRMRLHGKNPDADLFGKIITGLYTSGRIHQAANYLDEMVLSGILPNRVTQSLHVRIHNDVILGLCRDEIQFARAFQVYLSTRTRGILVEPKTFQVLVVCLCKKEEGEMASRVVHDMLLEKCIPERGVWHSIVSLYWNRERVRDETANIWSQLMLC
ncbi:Pentatricopeptide repeat-containing protein [Rhynchospora pubera]|uniref:Pentatricopeptide repeat-containing protein n=1 Tax=Rhynchospora pubera TaxID=906938 RepID=A0AAV8HZ24_9POAL|nr:Pentatricopeptide repeat-containing protein [Rhynchospora pubera]